VDHGGLLSFGNLGDSSSAGIRLKLGGLVISNLIGLVCTSAMRGRGVALGEHGQSSGVQLLGRAQGLDSAMTPVGGKHPFAGEGRKAPAQARTSTTLSSLHRSRPRKYVSTREACFF
jgi:hypothetical protein